MKKRLIMISFMMIIITSFFSFVHAEETVFPDLVTIKYDINGSQRRIKIYGFREITQAYKMGFIDGYPDGTFRPNNSISREEFIKILMMLATNWTFDFKSVDTKYQRWSGAYVTVAEMQGVIEKDKYTEEDLQKPITRLEAVLMLAKTQIRMKSIPQNQMGSLVYTDIKNLTDDEKALVLHAAKYDLLQGMRDGTNKLFEPNKSLTRAEAAYALMRVY